ncbi:MAG: DNA-protecting protein DprA [Chloroflexota bacterium]|nr:DNA-protecting protein DprA [Chloroflexota bacterium]
MTSERDAWIALASVDGIGPELFAQLIATFGSASDVVARAAAGDVGRWLAERRRATGRPVMSNRALEELVALSTTAGERLARLVELGLWSLTPAEGDYPPRLRDLDPPPPVIHGAGERSVLSAVPAVAVVGTRRPTAGGRQLAAQVATRLVECGAVVASGVAVGIDGAAHAATLARAGATVGVIGGGHLHPGPRAHAALRRRIVAAGGALISEHYPTVHPTHGTYPRRNRIIAALAAATVVIEAPVGSGALITARHALELGRLVLIAPGRIGDWSTAGGLRLLRDSPARPLTGLDEMVVDLGYGASPTSAGAPAGTTGTAGRTLSGGAALAMLGAAERVVAERLRRSPAGLDVLVDDTGLPPAVVSGAVTLLLMRGWIQPIGPAYLPAGPLLR